MEKAAVDASLSLTPLNLILSSLNPKISEKLKISLEKTALILQSPQTRNFIEMMLIDPFLKYIFARIFPYILIGISLFSALFILIIALFVIILMRGGKDAAHASVKICPFCYS